MAVQRRSLTFAELDDILREVEQLQAKGYDKVGKWDLAQVCGHLAQWMSFPVKGFPNMGCALGGAMAIMRFLIGKRMRRKYLASKKMGAGGPTVKETVPAAGGDVSAAITQLREAIALFRAHPGEYHPSPLFGQMNRDEWTQMQLIHCAHHLSFLVPKTN